MGYQIVVDTREQLPLKFSEPVKIEKLDVCDYALKYDGKLLKTMFERKSGSDLLGTLTSGHQRFVDELNRANKQGIRVIVVVECSYNKFINKKFKGGKYSNRLDKSVLVRILHSTIVSHDLEVVFFNNREEMTTYITNSFEAKVRSIEKKKKSNKKLLSKLISFSNALHFL